MQEAVQVATHEAVQTMNCETDKTQRGANRSNCLCAK